MSGKLLNTTVLFAPQTFTAYMEHDSSGRVRIRQLPAESDPGLLRIRKIRNRNEMFLDTLQLYYDSFARRMEGPYYHLRREAYREKMIMLDMQRHSRDQLGTGILTVLSSLIPFSRDNFLSFFRRSPPDTVTSNAVGVAAGTELLEKSRDTLQQSKIHAIEMEELADALAEEIGPLNITVEDRIVSLSGTANEQFLHWQQILQKIYQAEIKSVNRE